MNHKRPVNLNLTTIHFPIPAIVSILHRISGILIFLSIPILLWLLRGSLVTRMDFYAIQAILTNGVVKFILWVILSALIYHVVAGIRHLLMDAEIGDSLQGGRIGAKIVLVISAILIILAGIWIW